MDDTLAASAVGGDEGEVRVVHENEQVAGGDAQTPGTGVLEGLVEEHVVTFPIRKAWVGAAKAARPTQDTAKNLIMRRAMRDKVVATLRDNLSATSKAKAVHAYKCALFLHEYHGCEASAQLLGLAGKLRNAVKSKDRASAALVIEWTAAALRAFVRAQADMAV